MLVCIEYQLPAKVIEKRHFTVLDANNTWLYGIVRNKIAQPLKVYSPGEAKDSSGPWRFSTKTFIVLGYIKTRMLFPFYLFILNLISMQVQYYIVYN